jgi:hypothetical protein
MHMTLTCPVPLSVSLHQGVCNQSHSPFQMIPTEGLHQHGTLQQPYINKHRVRDNVAFNCLMTVRYSTARNLVFIFYMIYQISRRNEVEFIMLSEKLPYL